MRKILIISPILLLLLFLGGCKWGDAGSVIDGFEKSAKIVALDDLTFDIGDINISAGVVEHGFHFINGGESDLNLMGAKTTCDCVTVRFELPNGTLSPEFGMDNSSWSHTIAPGEEFEVELFFDPMGHGEKASGSLLLSAFLYTSSEINGNIAVMADSNDEGTITEMNIEVNVVDEDEYKNLYGDSVFVFEESEFDFGLIKQSGGVVSHDFKFTYVGDDPIEVTSVPGSCICTSAEISKNNFNSGDEGFLTVNFDPNMHEEPEGKFFKTVVILTEPELEKQPEVKVWEEIDLDLGPAAFKINEKHVD